MKLSEQIERRPLFVAFGTSQQTGGLTSVDLEATRDGSQVIISASDGSAAPVAGADATTAGVMTAADKVSLDGLPPTTMREFQARAEVTGAIVSAAITHLRSAGYAMAGDGGGALYKRAGAEPAHALKVQSADGAWWELAPGPEGISVRQAGATGDGVTDDGQAIQDALAGVEDFNASGGSKAVHAVIVPAGHYYLGAHTLELKKVVHLRGHGNRGAIPKASRLRWDANVTGIIVHRHNTLGAGIEATPTGGADGSIIEGLQLEGGNGTIAGVTDATKGHGIWLRANATLRDLTISDFAGNGLHIVATAGGADNIEGNANSWSADIIRVIQCHQNGMYVDGADVNASGARLIDASSNGRWGIWDSSFLGNTYIACHSASNGVALVGGNVSGESSFVSFGGRRYAANVNATEADLVATEPGTDESVWLDTTSGSESSTIPLWQSGQPEGTYFHGGSYHTDNANAHNIFMGCYSEINEAVAQLRLPTIWFAGDGFTPKGSFGGFGGGSNAVDMFGHVRLANHQQFLPDRDLTLSMNSRTDTLLEFDAEGDHPLGWAFKWNEALGQWTVTHSDLAGRQAISLATDLNTRTYGRSAAVAGGSVAFEKGLWVGLDNTARYRTTSHQAPTSGNWAKGDIVWNYVPDTGSPLGWVCRVAGSPGFWREIRCIGDQTSGANQAAITNSTGGTRDGTLAAVSGSGADAVINDNFTDLHVLLNEVRTTLVNFGLMKGNA